MNNRDKLVLGSTIACAIVGAIYFMMSYLFGISSAKNYDSILFASLKMGCFSSVTFSICLALTKWKHRWVFLIPIVMLLFNAFQAIDRLKILSHH